MVGKKQAEVTSKRVAKKASSLLHEMPVTVEELKQAQRVLSKVIVMLEEDVPSVAASALTQAENKKK